MISYKAIRIRTLGDYDKILKELPQVFCDNTYMQKSIEALKYKIGLKCSELILEYPYYDSEYLSSYYQYYIKKFKDYGKASCRILFFRKGTYKGYITASPTTHYYNLSKSYLSPDLLLEDDAFLMLAPFKAHLFGEEFTVDAFPWMNQQKDFSMCAHVAAWSIMKFYAHAHSGYKEINIGGLVDSVPEYAGRKIPSKGLNLLQMADIFRNFGITPLLVKKESGGAEGFYRELCCYIESGIPVIAVIDKRMHAVSVVGHGAIDDNRLDKQHGLVDNSSCISSIIVNDDNKFPYLEVFHKSDQKEDDREYTIEDIDYMVVPLYNRVHQEYSVVYEKIKGYLKTGNLKVAEDSVLRIYLASSKSLKQKALQDEEMNNLLKWVILTMEMPKMVWCAEISSFDEYKRRKVSSRIIIDSTASPGEITPWLLVHDRQNLRFFSEKKWYESQFEITEYNMYQHNLKEVCIWK